MSDKITKIAIKIVYGYRPTDFVVVDNLDDVARAYYAKIEKLPLSIAGRVISGQEIKVIEPDIHTYTGWNRSYMAKDDDDFRQIERDVPKILDELILLTTKRVEKLVSHNSQHLIGKEGLKPELLLTGK